MIVNRQNLNAAFRGFNTAYMTGFNSVTPQWQNIAMAAPSTGKGNNYPWFGEFPSLREWIGDRQIKNLEKHGFSIVNKKFESTIGIKKDDFEDEEYSQRSILAQEMGVSARKHPDQLVFALLALGFATLCYDGQYFFDTDHTVGEGSVSNMQAGAGAPWFLVDNTRAFKAMVFQTRRDYDFKSMTNDEDEAVFMREEYRYGVDARVNAGFALWQLAFGSKADLTPANFDSGIASMMSIESDEGTKLGVMPSLLICGPSNRAAAKAVVEKEHLAGGESNTNYKAVEVVVVPWLT